MKKLFIFLCLIGFSEIAAQTQKTIYKNGQPIGYIIIEDVDAGQRNIDRTAVSSRRAQNDYIIEEIIDHDCRAMIIPQQPGQIRVTFRNFRTNQISVLYSGYAPARTSLLLPLNL